MNARLLAATFWIGWIGIALLGEARSAFAREDYGNARLIISNRSDESIEGLKWKSYDIPVEGSTSGESRRAVVDLEGSVDRSDVNLIFGRESIPLSPNPEGKGSIFHHQVQLTGKVTFFNFFVVDPYGQAQEEKIVLVFPNWSKFNLPITKEGDKGRRLLWSAGLGISYENYNEPGNIKLTEYATTGKLSAVYLLRPNQWELAGNAFTNLFPITYSPSDRSSARWWGVNTRVGYRLPINSVPSTNFWVMGGYYMWGMMVNAPADQTYGVQLLRGPEVFLSARVTPIGKRAYWFYFKYASIAQGGIQLFSTVNRELAGGAGYELSAYGVKHPISLTLDLADAEYTDTATSRSFDVFSTSVGVSVGF